MGHLRESLPIPAPLRRPPRLVNAPSEGRLLKRSEFIPPHRRAPALLHLDLLLRLHDRRPLLQARASICCSDWPRCNLAAQKVGRNTEGRPRLHIHGGIGAGVAVEGTTGLRRAGHGGFPFAFGGRRPAWPLALTATASASSRHHRNEISCTRRAALQRSRPPDSDGRPADSKK